MREFLARLYPTGVPDDLFVLIWTAPGKASTWAQTLEEAMDAALTAAPDQNVYIGCGLAGKRYGKTRRCPAAEVAGIPGVWADVDFGGDHDGPKTYPPTAEDAQALIAEAFPITPPTILIHSGHGLQAWWTFKEPWLFDSDAERMEAAEIVRSWQGHLRTTAEAHGWAVDSTHDLARVMRLPGTHNRKRLPHVPVSVLNIDSAAVWPDGKALADAAGVSAYSAPALTPPRASNVHYESMPAGWPDHGRMALLWSIFPMAAEAWSPGPVPSWLKDSSESARDMSVATYAARAGWPVEEIGRLLWAGRVARGEDQKHPKYYEVTVSRAMQSAAAQRAVERLEEGGAEADAATDLMLISDALHINPPLVRITRTVSDPAIYQFWWADHSVVLGDSGKLLKWATFAARMVDLTGQVIPAMKQPAWLKVVQRIVGIAEPLDMGAEGTETADVSHQIEDYLEREQMPGEADEANFSDAFRRSRPISVNGYTCISLGELNEHMWARTHATRAPRMLGSILRALGWEPWSSSRHIDGKTITRRYWRKVIS